MLIWNHCFYLLYFFAFVQGDDYADMLYKNEKGDCECDLEIYEANVDHAIIKSPHYPRFDGCSGRCIYQIQPHPNKTVSLYIAQFEISDRATLMVYSLVETKQGYLRIPHAKIKRNYQGFYYRSEEESFPGFVSAKNAGYEIHFQAHTVYYYTSFRMSFDRYYEYENICDYPLVTVGVNETLIQTSHVFRSASGCVYALQVDDYEDGDEIIIDIQESEENEVAVRSIGDDGKLQAGIASTHGRSVMKDAKEIQILSHRSSKTNGAYRMAKITARLVKKSCVCGRKEYFVNHLSRPTVSIRNPGYPDLFCPNRECTYTVRATQDDVDTNDVGILQIKVNALLSSKDTFSLNTDLKGLIESTQHKTKPEYIQNHFVVKQQLLEIKYYSSEAYSERRFEVNITHRMIPPQCVCSFYKDKSLSGVTSFEITFPDSCDFIYCNFHMNEQYQRKIVDFSVLGAAPGDHVVIRDKAHDEMYDYTSLDRVNRYEADIPTSFTYFRENVTSPVMAVLFFNFTIIENSETCNENVLHVIVESDSSAIITSPGYPNKYPSDQHCQFVVSVPEGHRLVLSLDEICLESYHDFVTIYEGNSTDGLKIGSYSAYHISHEVLNVSSTTALIVFLSDASTTNRGFHITATARPTQERYEDNYTFTFILIAWGIIFILIVVFAIYFYETRRGDHRFSRFLRNVGQNGRQQGAGGDTTGNTENAANSTGDVQPPQGNVMNIFD